ncbi:acyltransferase family protein [Segetibacter koreensis]|uniref:acyltransferase family protein n=1 Tax=Segetibacter koreensis TaxID=398037 RepID=UPI0003653D93|nr:acyltransferase [Segetibacter koreensis]
MTLRYHKELDGVRGIAALMVMYFHFCEGVRATKDGLINFLVKTSVFGQTGVILFFVLSGFLITRILLASKENRNFFKSFYIRRSLRIFPLYYVGLCIYIFVAPLIANTTTVSLKLSWPYWIYLQNYCMTFRLPITGPPHYWSLAVEEHFYLFWPLLVYYLSTAKLLKTIYALIITAIIVRIILTYKGFNVFYFTFSTMDALAIGAILAIKEKTVGKASKGNNAYTITLFLIFVALTILWLFAGGKGIFVIQAIKGTLIATVYYFLLLIVTNFNRNNILNHFLITKPLLFTGKISYGLYVYHIICYSFYLKYFNSSYFLFNLLGCFISSYIVASVSYFTFEVRFIALKERFSKTSAERRMIAV